MSKMNPEIKAEWVAALRSGEYKQGKRYLRSVDEEFCCLGVLCDLYAKDQGVDDWSIDVMGRYGDELPAPEVATWAALDVYDPQITVNGKTGCCSMHNDNGATFAQIADAIEAQL